jgi:S-(hydroxymethyl)glutathione dehydrogenase / alcohol dehydrogenase
MKARAAVLHEVGKRLDVTQVDVQDPGPSEVLVRMAVGGVCHSDLHVMTGHLIGALPAILGHEGSGVVHAVGAGVTALKPGDQVIPLWRLSCGYCEHCAAGRPALCDEGTQIRMTGRLLDGTSRFKLNGQEIKHFAGVSTFSEYSVIPERALLKIPNNFPLEKAALLGCGVITGVGAAFNAPVTPGSSVAVFGTGGVGLNVIQGAAIAGAEKIIAVDLLDNKLAFARSFGATHTVNASSADPVKAIRELTGGKGVELAFEVVGLTKTMRQAYDSLRKRGKAIIVGVSPTTNEMSIPTLSLVYEERILTGSLYGSARPKTDIPMLMSLYAAGKLKLDELLTRTYPFEQINEAYDALERGEVARSVVLF